MTGARSTVSTRAATPTTQNMMSMKWVKPALSERRKKVLPRLSHRGQSVPSGFRHFTHGSNERKDLMYYRAISQCTQMLENLESWLDKAEEYAAAKKFDVGVLMTGRLAPDMKPFIYQVQSACDYVKAGAAWLTGRTPPKHEDKEQTIDEVRARIRTTVAFAESVEETEYAGAGERKVNMSWAPAGKVLGGENYLLQMTLPNTYFHVAMAYAILRHNGVDIGKMDFLGPINWMDADRSAIARAR
jgi:uncharacterized protein